MFRQLLYIGTAVLVLALVAAPPASADQLRIDNPAACGGAVICLPGNNPFVLTAAMGGNLNDLNLPAFFSSPSTPTSFLIQNATGSTLTSLSFTLTGTLGVASEVWNCGPGDFATACTIDGLNGMTGNCSPGGGVVLGANVAADACNGGALPALFQWTVSITDGSEFLLNYQSPHANNVLAPGTPVPEPGSLTLLLAGLLSLASIVLLRR